MNPIDQMMECYGVEKRAYCEWCENSDLCYSYCEHLGEKTLYYPPFTAEKQIELIKLLLDENKGYNLTLYFDTELRKYVMEVFETDAMFSSVNPENVNFEECLASLITQLYEYLPRQRVKEILEG